MDAIEEVSVIHFHFLITDAHAVSISMLSCNPSYANAVQYKDILCFWYTP